MAAPPTPPASPCTEKFTSVTLAAGEQFVLPPGAILVAADQETNISDDGCLDRSQLEDLDCYVTIIAASGFRDPTPMNLDDVFIDGIYISNVKTVFNTAINIGSVNVVTELETQLGNTTVGGILLDVCAIYKDRSGVEGEALYLFFQTIPSIAKNLSFSAFGTHPGNSETIPDIVNFALQYPVFKVSDVPNRLNPNANFTGARCGCAVES